MKLLHPEIDLEPGRPPMEPPQLPNLVGHGSAKLRLFNSTNQENAFSVRIECDHPYWQEHWVTIRTPKPSRDDAATPSKADIPGSGEHSIKATFVPAQTARDVVLKFSADRTPEARCGIYHFRIIVEQAVKAGGPSKRLPDERGVLIVRPFTEWSVEATPKEQSVGRIRRSREYELIVRNSGNDWLYAELRLPKTKDVIFESRTTRIAVPPPEPGGESMRRFPVKATTRLKAIIGASVPQILSLSLQHLDAPSVPPLQPQADKTDIGAGIGAPVLVAPDKDIATPEPPELVYRPIPKTLTGFGQFVVQNIKGLVLMFIGIFVAGSMLVMALGNFWRNEVKPVPLRSSVTAPGRLDVRGKLLEGSKAWFFDDKNDPHGPYDVVWNPKGGNGFKPDLNKFYIDYTDKLSFKCKAIGFRRMVWGIPWPEFLTKLWEKSVSMDLTVGNPDVQGDKKVTVTIGSPITVLKTHTGFSLGKSPSATIIEKNEPLSIFKVVDDNTVMFSDPSLAAGNYTLRVVADGQTADLALNVQEPPPPAFGEKDKEAAQGSTTAGTSPSGGSGTEPTGKSTPSTGQGTGGGSGTDVVGSTPGYNELVAALQSHNFSAAYEAVKNEPEGPATLAIKALADAGMGGRDAFSDASNCLSQADELVKRSATSIEKAIVEVAHGWLLEKQPAPPDQPEAHYSNAEDAMGDSKTVALPRLMYLDYLKRSQRDKTTQGLLIRALAAMDLSPAEKAVFDKLNQG